MRRFRFLALFPAILALATAPGGIAAADVGMGTGTLTVEVGNVKQARGHVEVEICPQATFLKYHCPYNAGAPSQVGVTTVVVRNLPPGEYAAQVYQDANDNGKIDRALFGVPTEAVGFSNDAPIHLSPPKWDAAKFAYSGQPTTIRLHLRTFL